MAAGMPSAPTFRSPITDIIPSETQPSRLPPHAQESARACDASASRPVAETSSSPPVLPAALLRACRRDTKGVKAKVTIGLPDNRPGLRDRPWPPWHQLSIPRGRSYGTDKPPAVHLPLSGRWAPLNVAYTPLPDGQRRVSFPQPARGDPSRPCGRGQLCRSSVGVGIRCIYVSSSPVNFGVNHFHRLVGWSASAFSAEFRV
jgi:hypothetical protein